MAIYKTQDEVEDHFELVKLIKEKLLDIPQSSFTQSTTDPPVQSTTNTPVESTIGTPVESTTDSPVSGKVL